MSNIKTVTSLLTLSALVASCASMYRPSESIAAKMDRYRSRHDNVNPVPFYSSVSGRLDQTKGRRGPASASVSSKKIDYGLANYSNKRLYFLTLLDQYQSLKQYGNEQVAPDINICPSFHTSMTSYKEKQKRSFTYKKSSRKYSISPAVANMIDSPEVLGLYPELSLPVTNSNLRPRVIDIVRNKKLKTNEISNVVTTAINVHLTKTYKELSELCESGASNNYYIYENLLTHVRTKGPIAKSTSGINILLKTTLFSNSVLMSSFESKKTKGRGLASSTQKTHFKKELSQRLGTQWSTQYLRNLKNKQR
jgi:hypothetical protein